MKENKPEPDKTKEAKKILEKEQKDRMAQAQKELEEVMKKHNCDLSVSMIITQQGNIPQIAIIPK